MSLPLRNAYLNKSSSTTPASYLAMQRPCTTTYRCVIRAEIATSYQGVFLMIRQAQQILQRLDEIALYPNPLSEVEYIDLLIHAEEMDGRTGAAQRIKCLKTVRQQAELMSKVKDDKIFELEALKQAQQLAKAEAEKVGWLKKAATSILNRLTELPEQFK